MKETRQYHRLKMHKRLLLQILMRPDCKCHMEMDGRLERMRQRNKARIGVPMSRWKEIG